MQTSRFTAIRLLLLGSAVALAYPLAGQSGSMGRIQICESDADACSRADAPFDMTWTFNGQTGVVTAPADRSGVRLTIEKLDTDSILVRAIDRNDGTEGVASVYSGVIHGDRISGTVQRTWTGHAGYPKNGYFAGIFQDARREPAETATSGFAGSVAAPQELLVCENKGACNAAWSFRGNNGTGTWFGRKATSASLEIVRLEPDYIVIRRTDPEGKGSATYAASLRGDRYVGTIIWSAPGNPGSSTGSWTATVPQTNCSGQQGLDADGAIRIGQYALMFKRDKDSLSCYLVAARAGDATAQTAVGLFYYQGRETIPQDYGQAFVWLRKAADQGVYAAQRTVAEMYTAGQGTQRDSTMARIYTARADEQKHDLERRQDAAEQAQARTEDRMSRLLSGFVLGASFGLLF